MSNIVDLNSSLVNNTIDSVSNKTKTSALETKLQKAYSEKDKEKLKEACQDFESIMLQMVYKEMKKTIPESEAIPEDSGREIYQSMLDEKLIGKASNSTQIGLGKMLYEQMSKNIDRIYKK